MAVHEEHYRNPFYLHHLYWECDMTKTAIAEELGCAQSTVVNWMKRYGIESRGHGESISLGYGRIDPVHYHTRNDGSCLWTDHSGEKNRHVYVHRLLAVSEYGYDAVAGNDVHHKNGVRWDNRPDNVEPMSRSDHMRHHKSKLTWLERLQILEFYRDGDVSTYDLAEFYPVTQETIAGIIRGEQ